MSPHGGEIFRRVATNQPHLSAHRKRTAEFRAQMEAAVFAEPPDWIAIDRLEIEQKKLRLDFARLSHEASLETLQALGRRDRAIYLRAMMSEPSLNIPIPALKENRERAEAVRLDILDSANCLIPDEARLDALLQEQLQLEVERQKLGNAWSDGVHALESRSARLERLRKDYRQIGAPTIFSPRPAETGDRER